MPKPKPSKPTFQSYIGSNGMLGKGRAASPEELELANEPRLLPGEAMIMKTEHVSKFTPYNEFKQGVFGTMFITNFKLSFHLADRSTYDIAYAVHRNKLYGEDDIVLNTIDVVYQVSKGRRKKLVPGSISGHVKNLEIQTKDLRVHSFSFKHSPKNEAKSMVNAIIHHAFPTRLELLFSFEYRGAEAAQNVPAPGLPAEVPRYDLEKDWLAELKRLQVETYKTNMCNPGYRLSDSLPEVFVVPSSMNNEDITTATTQFCDYRCPFWSYTYRGAASLVRMAYLVPDTLLKQLDDKLVGKVNLAHPKSSKPPPPPTVYDLARFLPDIKDIQQSYEKLREACMPGSLKEVHSLDNSWYSSLDSTQWLSYVRECLRVALRVTDKMSRSNTSVIIKESECRDLAPLVCCLTQILLDPHFRTFAGFQSLVEREWVAMGHKFADRIGLVPTHDSEQSPVFLLFLDCVWQLQHQFPSAFEFSEVYLTTLWDTVCLGFFENFLFNSARERALAARKVTSYTGRESAPKFMSAWDWSQQFAEEDLSLFKNPLYLTRTMNLTGSADNTIAAPVSREQLNKMYARKLTGIYHTEKQPQTSILRPVLDAPVLKFWSHCYLRWLTPVQIMAGGTPSEYLQQCILVEEIMCFQHKIRSLETATPFVRSARPKSELIFSFNAHEIPSKKWTNNLTSSFPFTPLGSMHHTSFFGTPLSLYVETSLLQDSDAESIDGLDQSELESSLNEERLLSDHERSVGGAASNGES